MKVAMLGWELPPHNSGGLGVACYQLCRALSDSGMEIDFFLPYSDEHDIDFMNVRHAVPAGAEWVRRLGSAYESFKYGLSGGAVVEVGLLEHQDEFAAAAAELVTNEPFDVIHAHDWLTFLAGVRAKEKSGLPLVVHVHSVEADRSGQHHGGNPLVREIEEAGLLAADSIIAVSEHTKKAIIREYNIPAHKVTVIHNSIDHSFFASGGQQASEFEYQYIEALKAAGWRIVINLGRLTIQKGLDYLLRATAQAVKTSPKTLLVFVGDGEQRDELIMKAAEYDIADKVLFAGFQRGRRWRDAYKMADLFVMPSVSEPFGIAPLEAIGYDTPVLISKQSGVAEVLKNALKVDFWDVDKMAEYISAVSSNDALRDELRDSAKRELLSHSWHKQVPHFTNLYQRIIAAGARA
ncbi:glycosyltransferase family 1 protein [Patescibacteria group bacterium]|nr:MAG: glycosyltransferase family 1 protein [Patescibacteria group bacterium]